MVEKAKKHKKGSISEEDVSILLQRYPATTVLALLQEVAQVADVKIDWDALVDKTATGISSVREYRMLWRHLAYRDPLVDKLDDCCEPMDEDSDLEYELEVFPSVSNESATEAAACVKVLLASGLQSDSSVLNNSTVEAPLTINIPTCPSYRSSTDCSQVAKSRQGMNITIPVSVQKQPLLTPSTEELDGNGSVSSSILTKRKRKPWSAAEDMELIAAVKKCGGGNWANILKGDFSGNRTASQLSQRWAIIRKRQVDMNVGSSSQLSEAQLATRRAVSLALDLPMADNLKATSSLSTGGTHSNITPSSSTHQTAAEALPALVKPMHRSDQDSVPSAAHISGTLVSSKPRVAAKKLSAIAAVGPDDMVKAAAVAAGARIATPSDAASLLKAAQAKNAVHIMPSGGSFAKSTASNGNSIPGHPNVHFIRTGLASTPLSAFSSSPSNSSRPTQPVVCHPAKPAVPTVHLNASCTPQDSRASSETGNGTAAAIPVIDAEVKAADDTISSSVKTPTGIEQEKRQAHPSSDVDIVDNIEDKAASDNDTKEATIDQTACPHISVEKKVQEVQASISNSATDVQTNVATVSGNRYEEDQKEKTTRPSIKVEKDKATFVGVSNCLSDAINYGNHDTADCSNVDASIRGDHVKENGGDLCSTPKTCVNDNVEGKQAFPGMGVDKSNEDTGMHSEASEAKARDNFKLAGQSE